VSSDEIIVGLDIGTNKVCAVIGDYNESNELEILGVGSCPSKGIRRGIVVNIEATLRSVADAIEAAEMMSGREVHGVFTGIAGGHIDGINSKGVVAVTGKDREIRQDDVDRVIEAAKAIVIPMDREVFHVIPQEYIVDDQGGVRNPLDMIGIRLEAEVHIITGSVTSAQNLLKCVNRAGFKVNDIVLGSLASSLAVLSEDEKELGVLLVDIGGGTTDVLLHLEGSPYHTDVISLGGSQVTSDLSILLKTPLDAAEKIKQEAGCCFLPMVDTNEEVIIPGVGGWPTAAIPKKEMCRIIQSRMTEIFAMVKEQIEKKGYLRHLGGGVVLTGGGSLLQGSADLAKEVFGIPVRIGFPQNMGGLVDEYRDPIYATAVGLVLYGAAMQRPHGSENISGRMKGEKFLDRLREWMKEFF